MKNRKKRLISIMLLIALVLTVPLPIPNTSLVANAASGVTYYVSSLEGSDRNSGTSQDKPFYSLKKINEIELQPGDKVLLEAGSVFENQYLHIKGSGSEEAPIKIGKYGEGKDPIINTNGQGVWYQNYEKSLDNAGHKRKGYVSTCIFLYDVEYIEISDIEMTNKDIAIGEIDYSDIDKMNKTGVAAVAQNKGTLDHIYLNNLNIHDVYGNVYDKHMNNGGIYFTVFNPRNEEVTGISRYDDVLIENCRVEKTSRWGIAVGYTAYHDKFNPAEIPDDVIKKYGSTNVVIRNNYTKDVGGDGITLMYCDRPLIEYNVSDGVAQDINDEIYNATSFGRTACAIWPWKCKDPVFQYNEAYDTQFNQDGQAWDADYGDGAIYQYNYSHNNLGGAVMVCLYDAVNTIFRYNISQNDLAGILSLPSNPSVHIYNNVFYVAEDVPFVRESMTGGTAVVENNIIYYAGETAKVEPWKNNKCKISYSNNLYYNYASTPQDDAFAITEDPKFKAPGTGPTRPAEGGIAQKISAFAGYQVAEDSPVVNAGKYISNNGGKDFFGNTLDNSPDIGVYDSRTGELIINSDLYTIDQEAKEISGIQKNTTVAVFLANLIKDASITVQVLDSQDTVLKENEIVTPECKVVAILGSKRVEYHIKASGDKEIKTSAYEIDKTEKTIAIPSLSKNPTTVAEVLESITVSETATIGIYDGAVEAEENDIIKDSMIVKVVAEDKTEQVYTIVIKNEYKYVEDFVPAQQGNVWFSQVKTSGVYENLTKYRADWGSWEGNLYSTVGLAAPNGDKGLLCNQTSLAKEESHAMAFLAPKSGYLTLSFKNPIQMRNMNNGGEVYVKITKNGELIEGETYQVPNNNTQTVTIDTKEYQVTKGDYIRIEAVNNGNVTSSSFFINPEIIYLDKEIGEEPTQKPTEKPTEKPTQKPTEKPTQKPTEKPTQKPTEKPTQKPTEEPTQKPTEEPTQKPTEEPTQKPTEEPTQKPTEEPTQKPTEEPTQKPTEEPTQKPTEEPTQKPTEEPTQKPTEEPIMPSIPPVEIPTAPPSQFTQEPEQPTITPTEKPTQKPDNVVTEEDETTKTDTITTVTEEADKTITKTTTEVTDKKTGAVTETVVKKEETITGSAKIDVTRKNNDLVVNATVEVNEKKEVIQSDITVTPNKAETITSNTTKKVNVSISEVVIKEVAEILKKQTGSNLTTKTLLVEVVLPDTEIVKQINSSKVETTVVSLQVPKETTEYQVSNVILPGTVLTASKDSYKNLKTEVRTTTGEFIATWSFQNKMLAKNEETFEDLNLALQVAPVSKVEKTEVITEVLKQDKNNTETNAILVSMETKKDLPVATTINLAIAKKSNAKAGDTLYLYAINEKTKKLEAVPNNKYKVSKAGNVAIHIIKGGNYVLLAKKPSLTVGVPLTSQVKVETSKSITGIGKQTKMEMELPNTVKIVTSFSKKAEHKAIGEVKASYQSGNANIATVAKDGTITSKKKGSTIVTTTFTFADGKKKVVRTNITVK